MEKGFMPQLAPAGELASSVVTQRTLATLIFYMCIALCVCARACMRVLCACVICLASLLYLYVLIS